MVIKIIIIHEVLGILDRNNVIFFCIGIFDLMVSITFEFFKVDKFWFMFRDKVSFI